MKMDLGPVRPYVTPAFTTDDQAVVDAELQRRMRRPMVHGGVFIGVFVVAATLLASVLPISAAVIAPGQVRVEASRKVLRQLVPGTVKQILVREGQRVKAGQVLLRMDEVQARASNDVMQNQYDSAQAQSARYQAEATNARTLAIPAELNARASDPGVAALIRDQQFLFTQRLSLMDNQLSVLEQRIQQFDAQAEGVQAQIASVDEQAKLTREELAGYKTLNEKGYAPKTLILRYERSLADLAGRKGALVGDLSRIREQVGEARLQMATLRQQRMSEAADGLREMQSRMADVGPRLAAARQALDLTTVKSPADGFVLNLSQHTIGGMVGSGERLMDIVPADAPLIITAKVRPQDIDDVRVGMKAKVRLSAFNSRFVSPVEATVVTVSADALSDEKTGQPFFLADLQVPPEQLAKLPGGRKLTPGMPADAMIVTGERTVLSYVLSPLTDTVRDAMREP